MIAHYNHDRGNLNVDVPDGMKPYWVKYMLRSIVATRGYWPYGTWLEFSDNRNGYNSAAI